MIFPVHTGKNIFKPCSTAVWMHNKGICLWECTFSFPFAMPPSVWLCHRLIEKNHTECVCICVFLRKRESIFLREPEWRHPSGHQGYLTPRTQTVRGRWEERRKDRRKEGRKRKDSGESAKSFDGFALILCSFSLKQDLKNWDYLQIPSCIVFNLSIRQWFFKKKKKKTVDKRTFERKM